MKTNRLLACILILGSVLGSGTYGKTLEEETPTLVQALAKQLVAKKRPKVATLDFTDIQGRANELGRFLAEQLAVDMVAAEGITVIDRANINSVMAEHQLTAEGLVKPENAKKLGQFAGVDALLIGSVAAMDNVFTLTVKAISTETAEVVAAGRMKFDVTQDSMKQFGTVLSGGAPASPSGSAVSSPNASSQESTGIATKTFDNLEVVLKTVTSSTVQSQRGQNTPALSCSFEFFNRDLRSAVVVAANAVKGGNSSDVELAHYRGSLTDSHGTRWWIPQGALKGLGAVMGFECTICQHKWNVSVAQNNPTAVAEYVRRGQKAEFGQADQPAINAVGKCWAGSFSTVPPGKSCRVTMTFIPNVEDSDQLNSVKPVDAFTLEMELVVGSVSTGEEAESAKDLRLENLTFDKIVMPQATVKK